MPDIFLWKVQENWIHVIHKLWLVENMYIALYQQIMIIKKSEETPVPSLSTCTILRVKFWRSLPYIGKEWSPMWKFPNSYTLEKGKDWVKEKK